MDRAEKAIAEAAFAVDELRLFLDTHPTCQQALEAYRDAAAQLRRSEQALHHSVCALDAGKDGQWDWTQTPWPWEKED